VEAGGGGGAHEIEYVETPDEIRRREAIERKLQHEREKKAQKAQTAKKRKTFV
jgi:hypothetical protein